MRVPTTAPAEASVVWGTPPLQFTVTVKPTGRVRPVMSHTAWLAVAPQTEVTARTRHASVKPDGKVSWDHSSFAFAIFK